MYYAATVAEGQLCEGADVIVVGGGNSAGQAAVFLAMHARRVTIAIRGNDLHKNMSSYLVHRIEQTPNIELLLQHHHSAARGHTHLRSAELVNSKTGEQRTVQVQGVFSFIGADPRTAWLPEEIERDAKGFVRTGPDVAQSPPGSSGAPAVPAGDQPARRVRRRRRAVGLGEAGGLGSGRRVDGGAVRARTVKTHVEAGQRWPPRREEAWR